MWLAIWSKPRAEKVALGLLASAGVPAWLPTITVRRRWSDRWKDVELPLFPGYLFAQTTPDAWPQLLRVRAVLTVVKQGHQPAWIREHQMEELRAAVERIKSGDEEPEVVEDFELGTRVRVVDGPFAGLVGVVREKRGARRLLVGFEQIGRAVSIAIGAASVTRAID
jgi:transcription antitermination factor NusG